MDRPDAIQLILTNHRIDAYRASNLLCPPGIVLVEMLPAPDLLYGLFLPDQVAADCRPDVGIVLAAGPDVTLTPGQMVAVRGYDGQWVDDFVIEVSEVRGSMGSKVGGGVLYATDNQIRIYGKATPFEGEIHRTLWAESIPVAIDPSDETMTATHNNLIVRREPLITSERGLELPNSACYRTGLATILSIGPKCDLALRGSEAEVGDRIHYDTRGELEFAFGGDPELAVIPDVAVNFVIRESSIHAEECAALCRRC